MNQEKEELKEFLRKRIQRYCFENSLTQEEMAEKLHISVRAYQAQERGKYGFSAVCMAAYLLLLTQEEREEMLEELYLIVVEGIGAKELPKRKNHCRRFKGK